MTVDLVINVFERNYRTALCPQRMQQLVDQHCHVFGARVVLINNVQDPAEAHARAYALERAGLVDRVERVADHLARALAIVGLTHRDLGRVIHYSDSAFVAVTLSGSPWLLYWDPEADLDTPTQWICPALELLERDRRILVANPRWHPDSLKQETREIAGRFALGYGFSDQAFLARRADLAQPIYSARCLASLRYPMQAVAPIFEARVDAHMRVHRRLRATHLDVAYRHPPHPPTGARALPLSLRERWRARRNRWLVRLARHLPGHDPRWHI